MLGDMLWYRQLNEDSVNGRIIVVLGDVLKEFRLGNCLGKVDQIADDVCLLRTHCDKVNCSKPEPRGFVPLRLPSISYEHKYL